MRVRRTDGSAVAGRLVLGEREQAAVGGDPHVRHRVPDQRVAAISRRVPEAGRLRKRRRAPRARGRNRGCRGAGGGVGRRTALCRRRAIGSVRPVVVTTRLDEPQSRHWEASSSRPTPDAADAFSPQVSRRGRTEAAGPGLR
jgi:hypothetical protein